MLKVKNLTYLHNASEGVKNINFEVQPGEFTAIIGESGCGKSTLLKSIFGLYDLKEGHFFWNKDEIKGPKYNLIPGYEHFKYLAQEFDLMPYISVEENIKKHLSRQFPEESQLKTDELLQLLELKDLEDKMVKNLSGGQKQRVAIGRALAKKPQLILFDEPFSHIDQFKKHKLRREIFSYLKKENISLIVATHDMDDVLGFADSIMVLKNGEQIDYRKAEAVYNKPKNMYCASLFGEVNQLMIPEIKPSNEKIIIYPEEIKISENAIEEADVLNIYFKGQYYMIIAKYKGEEIIINSVEKPTTNQIKFHFDLEKINNRLNYKSE
ncbi:MAG: ABC transporter ATP-binding protein [Psychroflexus halocasei]